MLYRIEAPHFTAGFETGEPDPIQYVRRSAPILRYMVGWTFDKVVSYCKSNGWKLEEVTNFWIPE